MSAEIVEILTPVGTLEVTAPASAALEVSTVSATLEVTNVSPVLEITTPTPFILEIASPGPQGARGPTGAVAPTFESVAQNIEALNAVSTSFVDGVSLVKTFDSGSGTTIISTLLFDIDGLPSTKTLSGTGLPAGIATVCTYDFTGREIPLKTYS